MLPVRSLSQPILWHRRYGHRLSKKLRATAKHVIGLPAVKDPAFCQCCAQSNLTARARSNQHVARRPQADEVLGQVSLDLVEYSTEANGVLPDMHGCRYAAVFIDGCSRYSYS